MHLLDFDDGTPPEDAWRRKLRVPITATRVVYRVVVPHASCGMDINQPTHLRVGKTTNAHTHLFFPPEPSHTRACGQS